MARLIVFSCILFFSTLSLAFDIEIEVVFPGTSMKSGMVLGFDKNHEYMLYPVHTYGRELNQIGFFKRKKTDLLAYISKNVRDFELDTSQEPLLERGHTYKIFINGKQLKPTSSHFAKILENTAKLEVSPQWTPVRAQRFHFNKKKLQLTVETFFNGKTTGRTVKPIFHICQPGQGNDFATCTTSFGTMFVPYAALD